MLQIILGIIVGFIVWLLVFIGVEPIAQKIAPNWIVLEGTTYTGSVAILIPYLIRSMIASILAGLTASLIASENSKTPLILGIILLLVALPIHISGWNTLPVWYHLSLLILLIPMTILGGKLKKREPLA